MTKQTPRHARAFTLTEILAALTLTTILAAAVLSNNRPAPLSPDACRAWWSSVDLNARSIARSGRAVRLQVRGTTVDLVGPDEHVISRHRLPRGCDHVELSDAVTFDRAGRTADYRITMISHDSLRSALHVHGLTGRLTRVVTP